MRLLTYNASGTLVFCTFSNENDRPAYAILSHTWHKDDDQEVNFDDVQTARGISKLGFEKIQFCSQQTATDGLQYFWIDTCCIDRKSSAEISEAINSMFRWYQQSTKCYVYLSDVSTSDSGRCTRVCQRVLEASLLGSCC